MAFNLQRIARYYSLRFKRLRGDPRSLAMGTAVGVFIGITPTLPFHTIAIIGVTLLMRVSTIAALIAATVVSNPLTFAPQYYASWKVGDFLLPDRLTWDRIKEVLEVLTSEGIMESIKTVSHLSMDAVFVMMTGGVLIALPLTFLSYYLSLRFFIKIREKRRRKHLLD
jgi:uncharacterized protein (DUF2062 family)